MNYIPGFSNYLQAAVPRYALGGRVNQGEPLIDDMEFSDYGLGGPMMGAAVVGAELASPMYGGPEGDVSYTGGMGNANPGTEAERRQAILDVNPYVAPTEGMNLNPITSNGQTGYYFANEMGLPARYGDVGSPKPADPATYDPNAKYIAPMPGFVPVDQNATYRLVNGGTDGSVVYAGAGEEGLRNVFQQANQLTMDNPKNAYWGVEVLDPATGQYKRVAENQGPNGLGIVGDIAGVALPIAAAIATGGASLGVQIAAGAAAGGLGGFLSGKDILKSALIGGATAGIGNASGLNKAIGGALGKAGGALGLGGAAAGGLANAAGEATGDIVVTGLSKALQGAGSGVLQGLTSAASNNLGGLTGYKTPAEQFVQQPSPITDPTAPYDGINVIGNPAVAPVPNYSGALSGVFEPIATDFLPKGGLPEPLPSEPTPVVEPTPADDTIVVSGNRAPPVSGSGSPFGAAFSIPVNAMLSGAFNAAQSLPQQQPTAQEPTAEDIEAAKNPMVVTGGGLESLNPEELLAALGSVGGLAAATAGGGAGGTAAANDIVVTGSESLTPDELLATLGGAPTSLLPDNFFEPPSTDVNKKLTAKDIADYLRLASLGVSTVGGLLGDKGGGSGGTIPAGMGGLSSVFGKQLPTSTLLGGAGGGALPASTLASQGFNSPQNYYRYGYGPEQSFFDYATQGAPNTSRAYTGYEGTTAEDAFAPQPMRMATPQITLPQPITTPIPNNPAGPSMYARDVDSMRFALGGPVVEGNIDLHNRPVVKNEDGTISTVLSMSIGTPEGEVLIPKVSEDGRILSEEEAVQQYRVTGRHLGVFQNPEDADTFAQDLSVRQGAEYGSPKPEYARGGFAVEGAGDGRDDKIPALLSDGEYVFDAETVALLGNGSNKAGAKLLDSFRVKVRKQKGKKLARGKFSDNAKRPEQYMAGGPA